MANKQTKIIPNSGNKKVLVLTPEALKVLLKAYHNGDKEGHCENLLKSKVCTAEDNRLVFALEPTTDLFCETHAFNTEEKRFQLYTNLRKKKIRVFDVSYFESFAKEIACSGNTFFTQNDYTALSEKQLSQAKKESLLKLSCLLHKHRVSTLLKNCFGLSSTVAVIRLDSEFGDPVIASIENENYTARSFSL